MATWLVIGEAVEIGDIGPFDYTAVSLELPAGAGKLTITTSPLLDLYVSPPEGRSYEGAAPYELNNPPAGEYYIEVMGRETEASGVTVTATTGAAEPEEPEEPEELNCFWAPESVVGLSKVCTAAAPSPWAYIATPPEDWTPRPGGNYQTLGFPLADALAGVTTATLTGVKVARAYTGSEEDDNDSGVMVSSSDDPSSIDYIAVSAPAVLDDGGFGSWMVVESWLSPPLASYSYAIIACRWDTNIGVVYTLSYRGGGV